MRTCKYSRDIDHTYCMSARAETTSDMFFSIDSPVLLDLLRNLIKNTNRNYYHARGNGGPRMHFHALLCNSDLPYWMLKWFVLQDSIFHVFPPHYRHVFALFSYSFLVKLRSLRNSVCTNLHVTSLYPSHTHLFMGVHHQNVLGRLV